MRKICSKHREFTIMLVITSVIFPFTNKFVHRFAGFPDIAGLSHGHSSVKVGRAHWQELPLNMLQHGLTRCADANK